MIMVFEGTHDTDLRDETAETFGEDFVVEAENSVCGLGCDSESACTHAPEGIWFSAEWPGEWIDETVTLRDKCVMFPSCTCGSC